MGACEEVYSLQEQNTFIEGSKPLTMHSMGIAQEAMKENQQQQPEEVVDSALAQRGASLGGAPTPTDDSGDDMVQQCMARFINDTLP